MESKQQFLIRLQKLEARIKKSCERAGRNTSEVQLMAVTKTHPVEAAEMAVSAGLVRIGENRVQEAARKRPQLEGEDGLWELIGPLQSNKARLAVQTFDRIQTIDRLKLVNRLAKICGDEGLERYPVLMQVNVGEDPSKAGCSAGEALSLAEAILASGTLQLQGLMTIGEFSDEESVVRPTFAKLRRLRDSLEERLRISLPELSMGMSGDLEWAIEEGSTLIRVGTALFGER